MDEQRSPHPAGGANSIWRYAPVVLVIAGLVLGYALGLQNYLSLTFLAEQREALRAYVDANFLWSALLFLAVYILAVAFSFPAASVLTIFGGFLFGWLIGGALVAVGATIGASILFLATRSAFGGFLRHRVDGVVKKMADGFRENAFGYLFVIRLAPVFPFFVVNIAAALFDISLGRFFTATLFGILPGTFAYAYLGQGVDSVLVAAQASGREAQISDLVTPEITLAFFALAFVALIPTVVKQIRKRGNTG
ncbi:putative membrane protein YdjX (TVP38/TMEM64 family) [Rhizobium rosettiformans]|uniref:TVP38/TMEM64 family membrane protein n=2 Tax=Rhizobium rosettiformans TaxID=1368430 RepID=A0A4S8PVP1_9HYPH|nr:TVP38/TMEM64 family protein [Rhizobium rosettiformans]MBB5277394.1 putative membrane protein YdjX (TVP38/TMEM64 family) [Rhizobium rosettiformans]THV33872.1 TVP38/TMEM64 family protein [Rhizobium rosettiformans W3]